MTDKEDTMLYQNMRAMISLVDRLRDFNLNDYISLPRIAVLGEQSAGKSSLLESVCGLNFLPRGSGIVTRRPLELRMVRSGVSTPYFVFPKDYKDKKFTDPDEVRRVIERLTDKAAGDDKNISDVPIVCTVYSPTVPDLTLIDLPGITRNPTADQPENIEAITKGLVRKYCEDPNTLILIVIPANIDISTSDALSFARKLDPKQKRSLGVITKIDLMDDGTDAREVLSNNEIKLKYGYVGIKGRSQAEIQKKMTVTEAIQSELDFFGKHPIYSTMPSNLLGTRSLIDRTSSILYNMIQTSMPKIQKEILERKKKAKTELAKMGDEFPETEERKLELVFKLIRNFKDNFDQEIKGKYFHTQLTSKKERKNHETITFLLNSAFADLYEDLAHKDFRITKDYTDDYIRNAIDVYQGESIPGFHSFDSFLFLIHPKLDMLKQPVHVLLDDCKLVLENKGLEIIDRVFKKFHALHHEVREIFLRVLSASKKKTRKIVDNLMKNEENYLFTNDSIILSGEIIDVKEKRKFNASDILVLELRARIDKYFHIVVRNMRDVIPKVIGQFLVKKFNETIEVEILNGLSQKDYCLSTLNENKQIMNHRSKLRLEMDALVKAENLLVNEFGMGFDLAEEIDRKGSISKSDTLHFDEAEEILDEDLLMDIDAINDEFLEFNNVLLQNYGMKQGQGVGNDTTLKPFPSQGGRHTMKRQEPPARVPTNPTRNDGRVKRNEPAPFKLQIPETDEMPNKRTPTNQGQTINRTPNTNQYNNQKYQNSNQRPENVERQQQRGSTTREDQKMNSNQGYRNSNNPQNPPYNNQAYQQQQQQQAYKQQQILKQQQLLKQQQMQQQQMKQQQINRQQQNMNSQQSANQYNKPKKPNIFGESNKNPKPQKSNDPFDIPLVSGKNLISNDNANYAFEQFNKVENKEKLAKDTYKVGKTVHQEVKKSPFLQKQAKKKFGNLFG